MKTILIFTMLPLAISCNRNHVKSTPVKPFVITGKYYPYSEDIFCGYTFSDAQGNKYDSLARIDLYHVGDTIK